MRRVVITGLGVVAPTGNNVQDAWKSAVEAKSGVRRISLFDPSNFPVQIAAEVKGLDVTGVMDHKEERRASRFVKMAAVAAHEAVKDSGLDLQGNTDRYGTAIGVGLGALEDIENNAHILREKGPKRISPFFLPYTIPNMATGVVSMAHHLRGPNICTTTACSSGTHSVGEAWLYITQDLADVMVCGGAESAISPLGIAAFASMKALSDNNERPEQASCPFDLNRDGFVMGEGAGILVLEELEHARRRGAKIYAEVAGYGLSADAHHLTAPAPEGEGGQRCMALALRSAKAPMDQVDYINAHGTSTKMNDHFETLAIAKVFGDLAPKISISSTKGVTGHCLGAAGGIEAVYTALAVNLSIVPPTANYTTRDPDCFLDYTPNEARSRKIRYAISNSFGFGGTNASIVLRGFD